MPEETLEEQRINLVLNSYGLAALLEQNDVEEYAVVALLVRRGLVDLEDYFYTDVEEGEVDAQAIETRLWSAHRIYARPASLLRLRRQPPCRSERGPAAS